MLISQPHTVLFKHQTGEQCYEQQSQGWNSLFSQKSQNKILLEAFFSAVHTDLYKSHLLVASTNPTGKTSSSCDPLQVVYEVAIKGDVQQGYHTWFGYHSYQQITLMVTNILQVTPTTHIPERIITETILYTPLPAAFSLVWFVAVSYMVVVSHGA